MKTCPLSLRIPVSATVRLAFGALSEEVAAGVCAGSAFALKLPMTSVRMRTDVRNMTSPCLVDIAVGLLAEGFLNWAQADLPTQTGVMWAKALLSFG